MLFETEPTEVPFITPEVAKAREKRALTAYLLEDGRDPDPIWDTVARALWPATKEKQTHREALAHQLMKATYSDNDSDALDRDAAIIMARLTQLLMGKPWVERWIWDHSRRHLLRQRRASNEGVIRFLQRLLS